MNEIVVRLLLGAYNRLGADRRGQDLIEYALLAGALAVVVAGFLPTNYTPALSTLWQRVTSAISVSLHNS